MKHILFVAFLFFLPVCAFADYDVQLILAHKQKMEAEIIKRNKLLDDIGIPRNAMTSDTLTLTNINSSELSVENSLDALVTFLLMLNNIEKEKDKMLTKKLIVNFKHSTTSICTLAMLRMAILNQETENLKIKQEIEIQIENARTACYILGGGIIYNKKFIPIY